MSQANQDTAHGADDPQRQRALFGAMLAVVAWSFGPLFVRAIDATTLTKVFYRFWLAQPVMISVAYLTGGRLTWSLLRRAVVPGVLFAASFFASFYAFDNTSIANAMLIPALQPAVLLFVAPRLFGEHASGRQVASALVALAGVVLFVLAGNNSAGHGWMGDLFAVVDLILWTVYFVVVKKVRNEGVHAASWVASVFIVGAVFVTPFALVFSNDLDGIQGGDWLRLLAMVVGPGVLGHLVMTWAQRHIEITLASLLTLGQVPLSAVGAWIVYEEALGPWQIVGAAIVLASLAAILISERQSSMQIETGLSGASGGAVI